jgi:hypothetical protein
MTEPYKTQSRGISLMFHSDWSGHFASIPICMQAALAHTSHFDPPMHNSSNNTRMPPPPFLLPPSPGSPGQHLLRNRRKRERRKAKLKAQKNI